MKANGKFEDLYSCAGESFLGWCFKFSNHNLAIGFNMPYKSRWSIRIPECSLPTLLFGSNETHSSNKRCFSDAARPDSHFFTRASYRLWCQRFAVGLLNSQYFQKGDRVLLFSGNDLFFPVVFMGTLMAGGVFTGANPTYVARELAHQLSNSGATYLLCSDATLKTGLEAARQVGLSTDRIFLFNSSVYDGSNTPGTSVKGAIQYWGNLIASEDESRGFSWDSLEGPGECHRTLALNYSSGTTGLSKGVEISHHNYVANTLQFAHLSTLHPDYTERNERARWLCYLPMYHAMAQNIHIAGSYIRGKPICNRRILELINEFARNTCLHHAKIRLPGNACLYRKIQNHRFGAGASNCRCSCQTPSSQKL